MPARPGPRARGSRKRARDRCLPASLQQASGSASPNRDASSRSPSATGSFSTCSSTRRCRRFWKHDSRRNRTRAGVGKGDIVVCGGRSSSRVRSALHVLRVDIHRSSSPARFASIDNAILRGLLEAAHAASGAGCATSSSTRRSTASASYQRQGDDLFAPYVRPHGLPIGSLTSRDLGERLPHADGPSHRVEARDPARSCATATT